MPPSTPPTPTPTYLNTPTVGDPHLIMQIHDELIYEVGHPDGDIRSQQEAFVQLLHACMEREVVQVYIISTILTNTPNNTPLQHTISCTI